MFTDYWLLSEALGTDGMNVKVSLLNRLDYNLHFGGQNELISLPLHQTSTIKIANTRN